MARRVARSDSTVLLSGESGTEKSSLRLSIMPARAGTARLSLKQRSSVET